MAETSPFDTERSQDAPTEQFNTAFLALEGVCQDFEEVLHEIVAELDDTLQSAIETAEATFRTQSTKATTNGAHKDAAEALRDAVEAAKARALLVRSSAARMFGLIATTPSLVKQLYFSPEELAQATSNPLTVLVEAIRAEAVILYDTGQVLEGGEEVVPQILAVERLLIARMIESHVQQLYELVTEPKAAGWGLEQPLRGYLEEVRNPSQTIVDLLRSEKDLHSVQHVLLTPLTKRRPPTFSATARSKNPSEEDRYRAKVRIRVTQLRLLGSYVLKNFIEDPNYGVEGEAGRKGKVIVSRGVRGDQ